GEDDDHDDGRVALRAEDRLASQGEARADAREDEADLAAGNHRDADREAVAPTAEDTKGAEKLPDDGGKREGQGQADGAFDGEGGEVGAEAHDDEEDGGEKARDGMNELVERVL